MSGVELSGFDDLERAFEAMAEELNSAVAEELEVAAAEVTDAMRARAEQHRKTGLTAADISYVRVDDYGEAFAAAGEAGELVLNTETGQAELWSGGAPVAGPAGGDVAFEIGADTGKNGRAFILNFLEFGTRHSPAKPIVRPTLDEDVPDAMERLGERLLARVTRAGGL